MKRGNSWGLAMAVGVGVALGVAGLAGPAPARAADVAAARNPFHAGELTILPDDGRTLYYEAFDAARRDIRIEICVLEDKLVLEALQRALQRGVRVRALVDARKYKALQDESDNLATYLVASGGELHVSNEIFPRSFPKFILVDERTVVVGSACLDSTTFLQYRDYAYVSDDRQVVRYLLRLFDNDWRHSAPPGVAASTFNPTPPNIPDSLIVAPVNASARLVEIIQAAERTLDLTSELLGDPTLESELAAAVERGVRVRLIAPLQVNGASQEIADLQTASLAALKAAGVAVRVTELPQTATTPYMHARTAIVDGRVAYLGSISLSPDSTTYNRGVGLLLDGYRVVDRMRRQFELDYLFASRPY